MRGGTLTFGTVAIVAGLYLFGHAAYDENRGIAAPPYVPSRYSHPVEKRDQNPEQFRHLMGYEWMCAAVILCGGIVIRGIAARGERSDPFSPNFGGKRALEDCEKQLDQELRKRRE
jgi:hypothetical protein